jgi:dUTP pyrophosphatase
MKTWYESKCLIQQCNKDAKIPVRAHSTDAGVDLITMEECTLNEGEQISLPTGIKIALPKNTVGLIQDRSSFGNRGIKVMGGVVDEGYTGEVRVMLKNLSSSAIIVRKGDRIAQLLIIPILKPQIIEVTHLPPSDRGDHGFGSTGVL